jgi:hypothetical protein
MLRKFPDGFLPLLQSRGDVDRAAWHQFTADRQSGLVDVRACILPHAPKKLVSLRKLLCFAPPQLHESTRYSSRTSRALYQIWSY